MRRFSFPFDGSVVMIRDDGTEQVLESWDHDTLVTAADGFFGPDVEPVPEEVFSAKLKYVLAEDNLLDQAEALVAQSPATTRVRWTYPTFYRTDELLNQMVVLFEQFAGVTIDLDDYFRRAKSAL